MRCALNLAPELARRVGIQAVVDDAKNAAAREFYGRLGLVAFRGAPLSLFLPVVTFRRAVGG